MSRRIWIGMFLVFIVMIIVPGCSGSQRPDGEIDLTPTPPTPVSSANWDPMFTEPECGARVSTPLLDQALDIAKLRRSRFGFTEADISESFYYRNGYLSDEFILPWFTSVWENPGTVLCIFFFHFLPPPPVYHPCLRTRASFPLCAEQGHGQAA